MLAPVMPAIHHVSLRRTLAVLLLVVNSACSSIAPREAWEPRLRGAVVVMLGEVHDNAQQHRLRLAVLRRAFAAGWRPAIAMEQFDRDHQADIEQARRERPLDAQHVIDRAAPKGPRGSGWNWDFYRPFVALALAYDVPLVAANLSTADAGKVVRGGYAAVFDDAGIAALRLDAPIDDDWQAAQQREIDSGHCHQLPQPLWPAMARAQFARDAVMASVLRAHGARGVVLLAGNGHVRRDIGVPRWLDDTSRASLFSVAYIEEGDTSDTAERFDAVVRTARATRPDPCQSLRQRRAGS